MKKKIKELCEKIEKENNVKILFAVENGSRAWRMESEDSDYDVRFVFVRPVEEYIQINSPKDVIQVAFDENGNECKVEGSLIDMSGFDVFKYLNLLKDSNPTTIEWIMTDVVYYGKQNEAFKKFVKENFNPLALFHHYKSMCRNNYLKYIKSGNDVTYKRYLYSFRGLINARYVLNKDRIPPISFLKTLEKSRDFIEEDIIKRIEEIIELKKQGKEKDIINKIKRFDYEIESFLKSKKQPEPRKVKELNELNKEVTSSLP